MRDLNAFVITSDGLVPRQPEVRKFYFGCYSATDTEPERDQVEAAKAWLQSGEVEPSKVRTYGSYGLKHRVEEWYRQGTANKPPLCHGYCSNGAFIQAAKELGIRFEPDGSGINAWVYIKRAYKRNRKKLPRIDYVDRHSTRTPPRDLREPLFKSAAELCADLEPKPEPR